MRSTTGNSPDEQPDDAIPKHAIPVVWLALIMSTTCLYGGTSATTAYAADAIESAQASVDEATGIRDEILARIDQLEGQIDEANASIPRARERLRQSVIATYKRQQSCSDLGTIDAILGCRSFDQMITVLQAQRSIQDMNADAVRELQASYDLLNASHQDLDAELVQAELTLEEANETLATRKEEEAERRHQEEAQAASVSSPVSSGASAYENSGSGLTKWGGVYYYNGHKETYYSSRVLRHYRIGEWHVDDEGFWRTAEGYYVVAANSAEYSEGTLIDTSKGLAQVLDCGCSYGTIDMYVNW